MRLGAGVNLTLATEGERYAHFRSDGEGARADPIRWTLAATRLVIVGWLRQGCEPDARCMAPLSPSSNRLRRRADDATEIPRRRQLPLMYGPAAVSK